MNRRFAAVVLTAALLAGCSNQGSKTEAATAKAPEALEVRTATAQIRNIDRSISVTGSLEPDEKVSVSSEVPGRISTILVDFGQPVRKGQVVAELDKQELQYQVDRAKGSLAQSLARLGLDPTQEEGGVQSTPVMKQAQAQFEDAKSKFENAQKLIKTGDISQERFTEVEKSYQARLALLEASRDDMRTLQASVQSLRADVKLAQKRLSDATIRAPFDGAVSEKLVSPGQYLKENTPILTVVKTNPLRLRVEVPESAAAVIRVGSSLTFTTDAAAEAQFNATVRQLNPSLDAKSRSLTVEARLNSHDNRLRPGMFVQVQLVLSKNNEIVVVPKQALYTLAGLTKVFVIRGGKVHEHRVTPGPEVGDGFVEVPRDAVQPGESVAVSQLQQLIQGTAVKAVSKG